MTTLTRISLNPARRQGVKLLTDPQAMHAAVRSAFPPDISQTEARVLWRVDKRPHEHVLYIVGPEKPTGAHIVEQAGWDTRPAQSAGYERFLSGLTRGQRWRFELVANPTYSEPREGKRGKVKPHVSAHNQLNWLYKQSERAGFSLAPRIDDNVTDEERARWNIADQPQVLERWTDVFRRDKKDRKTPPVRISKARFAGTLEVTDPERLRTTLTQGVGRGRAYGCGLLTLASVK